MWHLKGPACKNSNPIWTSSQTSCCPSRRRLAWNCALKAISTFNLELERLRFFERRIEIWATQCSSWMWSSNIWILETILGRSRKLSEVVGDSESLLASSIQRWSRHLPKFWLFCVWMCGLAWKNNCGAMLLSVQTLSRLSLNCLPHLLIRISARSRQEALISEGRWFLLISYTFFDKL